MINIAQQREWHYLGKSPAYWSGTIGLSAIDDNDVIQEKKATGRILITGSIAWFMPGTYQAVYNGTRAFLDSFSFVLRHELKKDGRHCHLPHARPTDTAFFIRADMLDTNLRKTKRTIGGGCRDWVPGDDARRRRCRDRLEEQIRDGYRRADAFRHPC
jgi:NAD(P)-dependent dehydrogenase (short-subunit alcohol dehydrogenase family)